MKIEDLKIVDAVFQEPNLTKIAERFHLSQSNLSKMIKKMELDLGFILFERKGFQGLRPTAQGQLFAERIRRFTRSWEDTLTLVKTYDQRIIDLKVTGPSLYMRNIFLPRWFATKMPEKYRLTYIQAQIDQLSLTAQASDVDLVITPTPIELLDWIPAPIFTEKFVLFSSSKTAKNIHDLQVQKAKWVAYHGANNSLQHFFHENHISTKQIVAYIEDVESILDILQNQPNLLSLLPAHAANTHLKLKTFAVKEDAGQSLFLMHRRGNLIAQEPVKEIRKILAN